MEYIYLRNIADPICNNVVAVDVENVEYLGADELYNDYGQLIYEEDDLPSEGIRAISYWDGQNNRSIILDDKFNSPIWEEEDAEDWQDYADAIDNGELIDKEESRGFITETYEYKGFSYKIRKSRWAEHSWFDFEILD